MVGADAVGTLGRENSWEERLPLEQLGWERLRKELLLYEWFWHVQV